MTVNPLCAQLRFFGLWTSPLPKAAQPVPRGRLVEGESAPSPLGFPVLRWISMYRHAVVNTPVARWVLIARGTAYSTRFPFIPSDSGLPHTDARSATTLKKAPKVAAGCLLGGPNY